MPIQASVDCQSAATPPSTTLAADVRSRIRVCGMLLPAIGLLAAATGCAAEPKNADGSDMLASSIDPSASTLSSTSATATDSAQATTATIQSATVTAPTSPTTATTPPSTVSTPDLPANMPSSSVDTNPSVSTPDTSATLSTPAVSTPTAQSSAAASSQGGAGGAPDPGDPNTGGSAAGGAGETGTGGTPEEDPLQFASELDQLYIHDACTGDNPSQPDTCLHEQVHEQSVDFGGDAGRVYDVTLRVRGLFEPTTIQGGESPYPDHSYFKVGGTVTATDYSQWHIEVSEPAQTYWLNHYPTTSHTIYKEDYEITISIAAGARVTARVVDGNDRQINNAAEDLADRQQELEGVTEGVLDGQVLRLDVISVTAQ